MRFLTLLLGAFVLSTTLSPRAEAQSKCSGKFVNPITDVCWSCLFPLSVGGLKIWPSNRADTENPSLPVCACGSPVPRIGISA
ncbi:MAG: conjugal transfer protein, partial [Sphingomonas sp.]